MVNWKNMFNLQRFSCITAITFSHINDKEEENRLFLGDEMGYIRVFDISELLQLQDIKPTPKSFKEGRKVSPKIEDV